MSESSRPLNPHALEIRTLLKSSDYVKLVNLCQSDRKYFKALKFAVYDRDEAVSRPAIVAIGFLMRYWWEHGDKEKVQTYMRTLFWSLNDESGGIGWNAPQQIAETIVRIPELADPYISMMISRCIDEPPLQENMLWSIGRMGGMAKGPVGFFADEILGFFEHREPQILGIVTWAMGEVGFDRAVSSLKSLVSNPDLTTIYIDGEFIQKPVSHWASAALEKMNK